MDFWPENDNNGASVFQLEKNIIMIRRCRCEMSKFRKKRLYNKVSRSVSLDSLNDMSQRDFELLIREYFRRWQFVVEEIKATTDGCVDLIAKKEREKYLIRCRYWKVDMVGVEIVRELLEVMAGAGATGGIVVISGEFTKDAVAFAKANNIMLLDSRELYGNLKSQQMFEIQPGWKTGRKLQKMKWVLICLLVLAICLYASLPTQIKKFYPNGKKDHDTEDIQLSEPVSQPENKDFSFTDDQVKEAMEEVLSKKKRQ